MITSCSNNEELTTTNQDFLFSLTPENTLKSCAGESRILKNKNEEIFIIEIKVSGNKGDKFVEFTVVETKKRRTH